MSLKKKVTKTMYDKAIELYMSGVSIKDISEELDISTSSIRSELKRKELFNSELRGKSIDKTEENKKETVEVNKIKDVKEKERNVTSNFTYAKPNISKPIEDIKPIKSAVEIDRENKIKIIGLHRLGIDLAGIVKETGLSSVYVMSILGSIMKPGDSIIKKYGVSADMRYTIVNMCKVGMSVSSISVDTGVSIDVIANIIRDSKVLNKKQTKNTTIERISRLYDKGYTTYEISKELTISYSQVAFHVNILKKRAT